MATTTNERESNGSNQPSPLEQLADVLASANLEEAVEDTRSFARRQPLWFLGGALVVGVACARLLKASAPRKVED